MSKNKETVTVVVGGEATEVEVNMNAPLRTIIPVALKQTNNQGQPPENWELHDASGNLLDLGAKIETLTFTPETKLFLNLKVGVSG